MTVLGSGRVSIAFPEAVRSFLAEQCPKPSHGDPIQLKNYRFLYFVMLRAPGVVSTGVFSEQDI